ncbi:hypothetical protein AB0J38_15775 [Streptomyces sp. NPDC050095]
MDDIGASVVLRLLGTLTSWVQTVIELLDFRDWLRKRRKRSRRGTRRTT